MPDHNNGRIIIAHPMDSRAPAQGGGIRYLMNMVKAFVAHGWSATVIGTDSKPDDIKIEWSHIAISQDSKPGQVSWLKYLFALYFRLPFMKLPRGAVIVTHRMDCMLAFRVFKRSNPKVMITAAPGYYLRVNHPRVYQSLGWLYRLIERLCLSGVDIVVPVDAGTGIYYQQHHPDVSLSSCIPSGVDLSHLPLLSQNEAREILGWPKESPTVLFVGRLAKVKNIPFLIHSFARVEKILPHAVLRIIGTGEEMDVLRTEAAKCCAHVIFEGQIAPAEIGTLYCASDVLALCSLEEGSPTVIKEALAGGLPVVSTDIGDVKIVLANDPLLGTITTANEETYSSALVYWLTSGLNSEDIRKKRRVVAERYSTENIGNQLVNITMSAMRKKALV